MDAKKRRKLSMARRVLDFSRANPADDPGYTGVVERLATQVETAEELGEIEREATIDERGAIERRSRLRDRLRTMIRHVMSVAEIAMKDRQDLVGYFTGPRLRAPNRTFLSDATVLYQRAVEHQELLLGHGLGTSILAEMGTVLESAEAEGARANDGKNGHVKARGMLDDVIVDCMDLVKVLDTFNRARFAAGSGELLAWESARDIYGPVQRAEGETTTPPSPADEAVA